MAKCAVLNYLDHGYFFVYFGRHFTKILSGHRFRRGYSCETSLTVIYGGLVNDITNGEISRICKMFDSSKPYGLKTARFFSTSPDPGLNGDQFP